MSNISPQPGFATPDVTGFAEAQDRKRAMLGSPITFLWAPEITFPPGTAINPNTGGPFDPLASGSAGVQASASATASVSFRANRNLAEGGAVGSPMGFDEKTHIFLTLASADGLLVEGDVASWGTASAFGGYGRPASWFIFHGEQFKILAIKDDQIITGYTRTLVYGAADGSDVNSGFDP